MDSYFLKGLEDCYLVFFEEVDGRGGGGIAFRGCDRHF